MFNAHVVRTESCAESVASQGINRDSIIVSGWPKPVCRTASSCRRSVDRIEKWADKSKIVAVPIPGHSPSTEFIAALFHCLSADYRYKILLKLHPQSTVKAKALHAGLEKIRRGSLRISFMILDHGELCLACLFRLADAVIAGRSTTGLDAATMNIPVVSLESLDDSTFENQISLFKVTRTTSDIAVARPSSCEALQKVVSELLFEAKSSAMQARVHSSGHISEHVFSPERTVRAILSNLESAM